MHSRTLTAIAATILALFAGAAVFAQSDTERVPTIEELFLTNPRLMAVREQALSLDRDTKLQALDDIEAWLDDGGYQGDEETLRVILNGLAHEGTDYAVVESRRLVNYYPMVRRKATELMARMASQSSDPEIRTRAKDSLIDVILFDDEVMVKAEAAYGLGVIGDQNGIVMEVMSEAIRRQTQLAPDNNFAYAVVLGIDKMSEANDGLRDYRAYTALVTIMQGNYTRTVKEKAFEVLQKIRGY